jgi:excisionase family DNA binding protein
MTLEAQDKEVLSVPEAAAFLGIRERTLRRWIVERGMPHAKVGGLLRFRKSALLEWLAEQERVTMGSQD